MTLAKQHLLILFAGLLITGGIIVLSYSAELDLPIWASILSGTAILVGLATGLIATLAKVK